MEPQQILHRKEPSPGQGPGEHRSRRVPGQPPPGVQVFEERVRAVGDQSESG